MRQNSPIRRGSCAVQVLFALAILGLILLIVGAVSIFASDPATAATQFETQVKKFVDSSAIFEAPGSKQLELKQGKGLVLTAPDGKVGDKLIGPLPAGVTLNVTVTGPGNSEVKFAPNTAPRNPQAPFEFIGFFDIAADGTYTVEVTPSDGKSPAAVVVGSGSPKEVESMLGNVASLLVAGTGGCIGVCGLIMVPVFGIPAVIMWRRKRNAPVDPIETL